MFPSTRSPSPGVERVTVSGTGFHSCGRMGCGRPAARRFLPGWRCVEHSPAGLPEPDPAMGLKALRARAGHKGASPLRANQLHDDRAVASGKRRGSARAVADARMRLGITPPPKPDLPPDEPVFESLF